MSNKHEQQAPLRRVAARNQWATLLARNQCAALFLCTSGRPAMATGRGAFERQCQQRAAWLTTVGFPEIAHAYNQIAQAGHSN